MSTFRFFRFLPFALALSATASLAQQPAAGASMPQGCDMQAMPMGKAGSAPMPMAMGASAPMPMAMGASAPMPMAMGASAPMPMGMGASGAMPMAGGCPAGAKADAKAARKPDTRHPRDQKGQ